MIEFFVFSAIGLGLFGLGTICFLLLALTGDDEDT